MLRPWLVLALLVAAALAGCSQPGAGIQVAHVHGVAYDAATGRVFLATHHGLARGDPADGGFEWRYVGDRHDYMGFTQDAERSGTFYTSGHPDDPRAFGGPHLGLRRSTDGGETWEQRSLKGEVDFHALTSLHGAEGHLAGFWQGALKVSRDGGMTWADHAAPPAPTLALGSSPGRLLAGTTAGLWQTRDTSAFTPWARLPGPSDGLVSSIAAAADGANLLAGTGDGRAGATYRSVDGGATWQEIRHPGLADAAAPVQFAFDRQEPDHAFAALADGRLLESRDAGATWTVVR